MLQYSGAISSVEVFVDPDSRFIYTVIKGRFDLDFKPIDPDLIRPPDLVYYLSSVLLKSDSEIYFSSRYNLNRFYGLLCLVLLNDLAQRIDDNCARNARSHYRERLVQLDQVLLFY